MYKIKFSDSALKYYQSANSRLVKKINNCVKFLKINPFRSNNIKRLSGKLSEYFRYKIGDYRLIYKVKEQDKEITIVLIENRSRVYKLLK